MWCPLNGRPQLRVTSVLSSILTTQSKLGHCSSMQDDPCGRHLSVVLDLLHCCGSLQISLKFGVWCLIVLGFQEAYLYIIYAPGHRMAVLRTG